MTHAVKSQFGFSKHWTLARLSHPAVANTTTGSMVLASRIIIHLSPRIFPEPAGVAKQEPLLPESQGDGRFLGQMWGTSGPSPSVVRSHGRAIPSRWLLVGGPFCHPGLGLAARGGGCKAGRCELSVARSAAARA